MKENIDQIFFEIADFCLTNISSNSAELAIEAINKNFEEKFVGKKRISKNWGDSLVVFKNVNKIMRMTIEKLFCNTSKTGFPIAKKFCIRYLNLRVVTIKDIAIYFLQHRMSVVKIEDELYLRSKIK